VRRDQEPGTFVERDRGPDQQRDAGEHGEDHRRDILHHVSGRHERSFDRARGARSDERAHQIR